MKSIITFTLILMAGVLFGQVGLKVEVSADTVLPGELVKVTYTIENGDGRFEPPNVNGLPLISGPNISSSFVIENGKKSSSQSYSYIFQPEAAGEIFIPQAKYTEGENVQAIESVTIVVSSLLDAYPSKEAIQENKTSKVIREKKKI